MCAEDIVGVNHAVESHLGALGVGRLDVLLRVYFTTIQFVLVSGLHDSVVLICIRVVGMYMLVEVSVHPLSLAYTSQTLVYIS
jgi:hypothetical protein